MRPARPPAGGTAPPHVRSIAQKLLGSIGVPALLVALGAVAVFALRARSVAEAAAQQEAEQVADLLGSTFQAAILGVQLSPDDAHPAVGAALRAAATLKGMHVVRVLGPDGRVVWSSTPSEVGGGSRLDRSGGEQRVQVREGKVLLARTLGGQDCNSCHFGVAGQLQLAVDSPRSPGEVAGGTQSAVAGVVLVSAALALATVISLRQLLTRPLRQLAGSMARAEAGDLSVRAEVHGEDEIAQLARSFNRMLETTARLESEGLDARGGLARARQQLSVHGELERANTELSRRLTALSLLYHVSRSLNATLELPELLGRISTLVTERLRIDYFSVLLMNAESRLEEAASVPPRMTGTRGTFRLGEGAAGRAAESLLPVYLPDLAQAPDARPLGPTAGSLLSLPVVHQGRLLGVLNLQRTATEAFAAEEVELLAAVADQAAMAIQNARLHAETVALSITDALTGLANRRHLFRQLEQEVARAARFRTQVSVVMMDLDHFKDLNDAAGHIAGDSVLRQVAEVLRGQVRRVDVVARYGGEEFCLVLPQVAKADAVEVADKLRRSIAELAFGSAPAGRVTASAGVAHLPTDATTLEGLLEAADAALYASKHRGRNRITAFEPDLDKPEGESPVRA
ncbi:MAG: diguanylate cyclase [Myxococcaceae bacterium]